MTSHGSLVVDVQTHLYPQAYLDALDVVARGSGRAAEIARETLADPLIDSDPLFTGDLPRRLELMDAAGVDTHLLSFPAPFVWSDDAERCRVEELRQELGAPQHRHAQAPRRLHVGHGLLDCGRRHQDLLAAREPAAVLRMQRNAVLP